MYPALMLRANQVIDHLLEASYERTFSYAEPAILVGLRQVRELRQMRGRAEDGVSVGAGLSLGLAYWLVLPR